MQKKHLIEDARIATHSADTILGSTLNLAWPQGAAVENLYLARAKLIQALANIQGALALGTISEPVKRSTRDAYVEHLTPAIHQALTFRTASFAAPPVSDPVAEFWGPSDALREEFRGRTAS